MRQGQKQVDLFQENGKVVKGGEAESSRSCLRKMVWLENTEKRLKQGGWFAANGGWIFSM